MVATESEPTALRIDVPDIGSVSALYTRPDHAHAVFAMAHGAGAPMTHAFMEEATRELSRRGVAVLRYQFPYSEAGRRAPDRPPKLTATVRAAWARAAELCPDLPLFGGGKSMGGRMSSTAAAEGAPPVAGLIFLGFPLHRAGQPGRERAAHLAEVAAPMLFVQGTRDKLADLDLVTEVTGELKAATLAVIDGADHGFHVLKRSGRTDDEVMAEIAETVASFTRRA